MKRGIRFLAALALLAAMAQNAFAFKVTDIRLEGLQRVSPGIVFRNFPLTAGDEVDSQALADAVRRLFRSGYFDDIEVLRDGDALVLQLHERPAISKIKIDGNSVIETEDLINGLKESGLQEGDVFKRATLEKIRGDLVRVYASQGRYGAVVNTEVERSPGNRVVLNITINEGKVAAIQHINIVGNELFSDEELRDLFSLKLTNFWSFYKKDDLYSRQKLAGDLEQLRSFYMDKGYLNFAVNSTQVSITPDRKHIYITVNIQEGEQYRVRDVDLSGEMVVPESELKTELQLKAGELFSRRKMTDSREALVKRLGNDGYMFANVTPVPEVHEEDKSVSIRYLIDPGKRTYVRRINIKGNTKTADVVVRQNMQQMEAAQASSAAIERSKVKLEQTGFFRTVNVETRPVPGTDDQVDLEYTVEEQQSGSLGASVGFSQNSGLILNLSVTQDNFLGSGKKVAFAISNSDTLTEYSFSQLDPYYTVDGVSRGYELYYRERDFDEDDVSAYTTDELGGGINFGYPIDDFQRLSFGANVELVSINTAITTPQEILDFIDNEGDSYANLIFKAGWRDNHLNRGFFPSRGYSQSASIELSAPGSDLAYYRSQYNYKSYYPLDRDEGWILSLRTRLGYADDLGSNEFPFYKHFFAGGLRTVRGFKSNSLGPKGSPQAGSNEEPDPFGGNILITGGAEMIFPVPFVKDQTGLRTLVFFDAGNVFDTSCASGNSNCDEGIQFDEIRYSVGFGLSWLTPVGPLSFAISQPLNDEADDDVEQFQFALGQTF
ncbi:outer membrane protein assembly factor BamA [Marinobacterium arenosum]|uniref:outer membrane protein assembly factor BamA n=1 Tax=Marinobacterium arenosum TaxID=2862496 RepID=UPI001C94A527|nr:outer membrane protein assembly factor BamA [Marinobacterium arenosum]MBY4675650.1 outer membrane protein assembly factor BamA [Marinobacterium arenosum]